MTLSGKSCGDFDMITISTHNWLQILGERRIILQLWVRNKLEGSENIVMEMNLSTVITSVFSDRDHQMSVFGKNSLLRQDS